MSLTNKESNLVDAPIVHPMSLESVTSRHSFIYCKNRTFNTKNLCNQEENKEAHQVYKQEPCDFCDLLNSYATNNNNNNNEGIKNFWQNLEQEALNGEYKTYTPLKSSYTANKRDFAIELFSQLSSCLRNYENFYVILPLINRLGDIYHNIEEHDPLAIKNDHDFFELIAQALNAKAKYSNYLMNFTNCNLPQLSEKLSLSNRDINELFGEFYGLLSNANSIESRKTLYFRFHNFINRFEKKSDTYSTLFNHTQLFSDHFDLSSFDESMLSFNQIKLLRFNKFSNDILNTAASSSKGLSFVLSQPNNVLCSFLREACFVNQYQVNLSNISSLPIKDLLSTLLLYKGLTQKEVNYYVEYQDIVCHINQNATDSFKAPNILDELSKGHEGSNLTHRIFLNDIFVNKRQNYVNDQAISKMHEMLNAFNLFSNQEQLNNSYSPNLLDVPYESLSLNSLYAYGKPCLHNYMDTLGALDNKELNNASYYYHQKLLSSQESTTAPVLAHDQSQAQALSIAPDLSQIQGQSLSQGYDHSPSYSLSQAQDLGKGHSQAQGQSMSQGYGYQRHGCQGKNPLYQGYQGMGHKWQFGKGKGHIGQNKVHQSQELFEDYILGFDISEALNSNACQDSSGSKDQGLGKVKAGYGNELTGVSNITLSYDLEFMPKSKLAIDCQEESLSAGFYGAYQNHVSFSLDRDPKNSLEFLSINGNYKYKGKAKSQDLAKNYGKGKGKGKSANSGKSKRSSKSKNKGASSCKSASLSLDVGMGLGLSTISEGNFNNLVSSAHNLDWEISLQSYLDYGKEPLIEEEQDCSQDHKGAKDTKSCTSTGGCDKAKELWAQGMKDYQTSLQAPKDINKLEDLKQLLFDPNKIIEERSVLCLLENDYSKFILEQMIHLYFKLLADKELIYHESYKLPKTIDPSGNIAVNICSAIIDRALPYNPLLAKLDQHQDFVELHLYLKKGPESLGTNLDPNDARGAFNLYELNEIDSRLTHKGSKSRKGMKLYKSKCTRDFIDFMEAHDKIDQEMKKEVLNSLNSVPASKKYKKAIKKSSRKSLAVDNNNYVNFCTRSLMANKYLDSEQLLLQHKFFDKHNKSPKIYNRWNEVILGEPDGFYNGSINFLLCVAVQDAICHIASDSIFDEVDMTNKRYNSVRRPKVPSLGAFIYILEALENLEAFILTCECGAHNLVCNPYLFKDKGPVNSLCNNCMKTIRFCDNSTLSTTL